MSRINGFTTGQPDPERYTPPEIAVAARDALKTIDLDPATTEKVNKLFLRAKHIYTEENSGLNREQPWKGKVFINPPGGNDNPRFFWERLMFEYQEGNVTGGIFLAFDIEFLRQSQNWNYSPMVSWPFCLPAKRITFYREKNGLIQPHDLRHGASSAIVYVGRNISRFKTAFNNIGIVVIPK